MKSAHHIAATIAALTVTLAASAARAGDAPLFGISVDAYAAPVVDRAVANQRTGQTHQPTRGMVGLVTLLNFDGIAVGAVLDGTSSRVGDGRLATGAVFGWQPRAGTQRYQLLGEVGRERFSDVGGAVSGTPSVEETWLEYVGARLGLTETFHPSSNFELGAWLFVRKNIGEATVANSTASTDWFGQPLPVTTTDYRLGGYSAGVALRVGLRFDRKRPRADESTIELTYEPIKS